MNRKMIAIGLVAMMLMVGVVAILPSAEDVDAADMGYLLNGMGNNQYGQQGDGTTTNVTTPKQIGSTLGTISEITANANTTLFITADGELYGMGHNNSYQLGRNNTSDVLSPVLITSYTVSKVVASASTTFFITTDGKLYGMGSNSSGQQGDGTTTNVTTPTQIGSALGIISEVSCTSNNTFFITADGKLYGMGQLTGSNVPTQIGSTLGTISKVFTSSTSGSVVFFITTDGKLYGMGDNQYGQQGDGTTTNVTTPKQIGSTLGTISDVAIGSNANTTFFITTDGKLYGMGRNWAGQQGDGTTTNVKTPKQIGSTLGTINSVSSSGDTTFFITTDGKLYGMGSNSSGQQGDGTTTNVTTPTQIASALSPVHKVVCDFSVTFFITTDGKLYGMGDNQYGQQGDGTTTNVTTPTQIGSMLGLIRDVYCSDSTTFFLEQTVSTVTLTDDGTGYGSLEGTTSFEVDPGSTITISGDTVTVGTETVTAEPLSNTAQYSYAFVSWTINDTPVTGTYTVDNDTTIVANFSRTVNTYAVTITAGEGGTVSDSSIANVPYGTTWSTSGDTLTIGSDTVTATPNAATAQYTYSVDAWSPASGTVEGATAISVSFTATLNSYTITYVVSGESTSETLDYGAMPAPEDPVAPEGYRFYRWDPAIVPVTGNATYTAVFVEEGSTVIVLDPAGGSVGTTTIYATQGQPIGELPTPTRMGFDFDGWFTAAEGGTEVTAATIVTEDMTIYAHWEITSTWNTYKILVYAMITLLFVGIAVAILRNYVGGDRF